MSKVLKRIVGWYKCRVKKNNNTSVPYHDLAPVDNIGEESEYFKALDWALGDEKIYNVAISAPYGAGKSSVIESYIKNRDIKSLQLSLANFSVKDEPEDFKEEEIEKEFLKKLFYKANYKKTPQSRFRKLHKIKFGNIFLTLLALLVLLMGYAIVFYYSGVQDIQKLIEERSADLHVSPIVVGVFLLFLILISLFILSSALKWTISKCKNWEIRISDKAKITTNDDSEKSIFNKFLDEIIYFFEEIDYEVVFIEDLDRFDSTKIFTKLRELNLLLNRYDAIKRHITFVYAIRDDYFLTDKDRTKFFDFIIPVVPYINKTNSDNLLRRRIDEVKNSGVHVEIRDEYLMQVSTYIEDMRVLTSIVNEFVTYKNTIKIDDTVSLRDEELLSLMVFKNLYPRDFSDIESEKGVVKESFRCKEKFISNKTTELENDISEAERKIEIHENDVLKDVKEIKHALFQSIAPNKRIKQITIIKSGRNYTYDEIIEDKFDLSQFENTKIKVSFLVENTTYGKSYSENSKDITDIEKEYNNSGIGYIERWKVAKACQGERKEQLKREIEEKKAAVRRFRVMRIKDLIKEYGHEAVFKDENNILENHLLIFMLRNGYIDEMYVDYINYFHPDSITSDEHEFILNLRDFGGVKYQYLNFQHPDRVIERLLVHEFSQVEVLNYSLARYLMSEMMETAKTDEFFGLLSSRCKECLEFIQLFIQNNTEVVPSFIEKLSERNAYMWYDIKADEVITEENKKHYFDLLLKNASLEAIQKMEQVDDSISSYMVSESNILLDLKECPCDKLIAIINSLKITFKNTTLEGADERLIRYIYETNSYEINLPMVGEIIRYLSPTQYELSKKSNYTIIRELEDKRLKEYVDSNIELYIEEIVTSETNTEEKQETIEDLMGMVNYDVEISKKIILSQTKVFASLVSLIEIIDDENKNAVHEIIDCLLEQEKVEIKWETIEEYYQAFGITDSIFNAIVLHFEDLCKEKATISEELTKDLIVKNWPIEKFRIFAETSTCEVFDISLSLFDEEHLSVLLDVRYIPYSIDVLKTVCTKSQTLKLLFFEKYKNEILDGLDHIPSELIPLDGVIKSTEYADNEKLMVLERSDASAVSETVAQYIMQHKGGIEKKYVVEAWKILPGEKKRILLNHIDVFDNKDLPNLFMQLDQEYHALAQRTNHDVKLEKTTYNEQLLDELKQKDYLTSVKPKEVKDKKAGNAKKTVLVCRVKEHKSSPIQGN